MAFARNSHLFCLLSQGECSYCFPPVTQHHATTLHLAPPSVRADSSKAAVSLPIAREQAPSVMATVESARPDRVKRQKTNPRRPNAGDFFVCA